MHVSNRRCEVRLVRFTWMVPVFFFSVLVVTTEEACAQAFPSKNITIVVPYTAGGSADVLTRAVAQALGDAWGHNVIVENRPGASGMIGAEAVARSEADGYTLLATTSSYPGT